jgi:Meiotically up-regulated gene 113
MTDPHDAPGQAAARVLDRRPIVAGVYFVRCGELIKIGTSTDVYGRVNSIRTMTPLPLELLAVAAGSRAEEADIHARFAHLRQHGEWFTAAPELLSFIAEVPPMDGRDLLDLRPNGSVVEAQMPVTWRHPVAGLAEIDDLAEDEDRDRSSMIRILLREAIAARKAKTR